MTLGYLSELITYIHFIVATLAFSFSLFFPPPSGKVLPRNLGELSYTLSKSLLKLYFLRLTLTFLSKLIALPLILVMLYPAILLNCSPAHLLALGVISQVNSLIASPTKTLDTLFNLLKPKVFCLMISCTMVWILNNIWKRHSTVRGV